jgi:hypothetical protein
VSRDPELMAEIRSRVADRKARGERVETSGVAEPEPRASLKRASTSAPPDERSEPKKVNSVVELEAIEARGDCFCHLEGSPLSWWKGVVSKSDIAFFQAGVTDAKRVNIFVFSVVSVDLVSTLALCHRRHTRGPCGATGFCTTSSGAWGHPRRSLLGRRLGWLRSSEFALGGGDRDALRPAS